MPRLTESSNRQFWNWPDTSAAVIRANAMSSGLALQWAEAQWIFPGSQHMPAAAATGSVGEVRRVLDSGVGVDASEGDGEAPLHKAGWGSLPAKEALDHGANVKAKERNGITQLMKVLAGHMNPDVAGGRAN